MGTLGGTRSGWAKRRKGTTGDDLEEVDHVEFDDFGRSMLEVAARRTGLSVGDLLCQAARRSVRGTSRSVPKLRQLVLGHSRGEVAATLELNDGEWRALEAEARRQEVPIEQLLEHAALHMLADLDGSADATSSG